MIGQGGMGQVFDGRDRLLGRKVALKKMRPEFKSNPAARERFVKEARLVSQLVHPNIVSVHDIVESEGDVYVVMDFVDGRSLAEILYARRRLGLEECRAIFQCVCEAVDFAHRSRILHRDLKPGNVMIDAGGHPKVMDFGLAREAKDTLSQITQLDQSGTPAYMAPEQHLGKAVRASDVYSLGVTLYEALTGQLPFPGPDFLAQKERMRYPPPQFLAPDPRKRLREAGELYAALKALSL
jgi:serine/threonine-protein kinase